MSDEIVVVGIVDKSPIGSPPLKKLKQSRLPFAPINTKSPKHSEIAANEKKRKLSGSDESPSAPKTPRSEKKAASSADENHLTSSTDKSSTDESPGEKNVEQVVKKGRQAGAKNKSSATSTSYPQDNDKKNVAVKDKKKRGRTVGGKKSSSDLNNSVDLNKSIQKEDEAASDPKVENDKQTTNNESVESASGENDDQEGEKPASDEETSRTSFEGGESESNEKSDKSSDSEDHDKSADPKSQEQSQEGKAEMKERKRGRPLGTSKKSITPQDEDNPKKKGRPAGSKNKIPKCSDAEGSNSPVSSKKNVPPVEKTRKLLSLFTRKDVPVTQNEVSVCKDSSVKKSKDKREGKAKDSESFSRGKCESENTTETTNIKGSEINDKKSETDKSKNPSEERTLNNSGSNDKKVKKNEKEKDKTPNKEGNVNSGSNDKISDERKQGNGKEIEKNSIKVKTSDTARNDDEISDVKNEKFNEKCLNNVSKDKESGDNLTEEKNAASCKSDTKEPSNKKVQKSEKELKKSEKEVKKSEKEVKKSEKEVKKSEKDVKKSKKEIEKSEKGIEESEKEPIETPSVKETVSDVKEGKEKELKKSEKETLETPVVEKETAETTTEDQQNVETPSEEKGTAETPNKKKETVETISEEKEPAEIPNKKKETVETISEGKGPAETPNKEKEADVIDGAKEVYEKEVQKNEASTTNLNLVEDKNEDNSCVSENENEDDTKENPDQSVSDVETSFCESEHNTSKTMSPGNSSDADKSPNVSKTPNSVGPKSRLFTRPKKLTPKQKEKEAARLLKQEERAKQLQEKMAEKEKLRKQREEEKKQKDEEKRQKEEERQRQKEERDKAKEELRKKRQEELDAKKQKKEEELQKKEEERLKKEEEKQKMEEEMQKKEEEKRKQKDKLKNKFASFFVAKKKEAEAEVKDTEGPFKEFRVKEDMLLAPVVRLKLSESQISGLDEYVSGRQDEPMKTYIQVLKSKRYVKHKSERTWPCEKKQEADDDDDVMIIEDEDEENMVNVNAMIQDPAASIEKGNCHRAKLLAFCENRRPAYWGTWSKKSSTVSARRPFARDEIFDYEYDSDDDWEEEEAGESLSDSEGEDKEEKEAEDQYEVDNDFFVPHGYLSDDEGKSDQEDDEEAEKTEQTQPNRNTEQLKQKQAEFEEEMKKKTKELKPRVIGCLWMADKNNNKAYDQLMKILGPHKAVTLGTPLPIGPKNKPKESKETDVDDDNAADYRTGNSKRFVKTFPEEAVPALIKLLHGNRYGKPKLCREFGDYWRLLTAGELEESQINSTPVAAPTTGSVLISKRKVEVKIQELGHWKRCLDGSKSRHQMCWYVPKKTREEYGLADLELSNSWIYINNPIKEKKEVEDNPEDPLKIGKMRPITAFAKKIPSTPSSTSTSPTSTPSTTPQQNQTSKAYSNSSLSGTSTETSNKTPSTSSNTILSFLTTPSATPDTPTGKHSLTGSHKKKVNLFPVKSQEASGSQKGSIVSFFKKGKENSTQADKDKRSDKENSTQSDKDKHSVSDKKKTTVTEEEVIVLD